MYLLVKTDGVTARGVSFALQQEQIVILPEPGECEDLAPGHLLSRCLVSPPIDEDRNFHALLPLSYFSNARFTVASASMMLQDPNGVAMMQHMGPGFDDAKFFAALERRRQAENLSWRQLGRQLDLSPSTFSRLARGRRPDIETFIKLLAWLDVPAATFMLGATEASTQNSGQDTLAVIADALQSDPGIPKDAAGALEQLLRVAYSRVRTTPDPPDTESGDSGTVGGR